VLVGASGSEEESDMEAWKLSQDRYVDAVRWLPSVTPSQTPLVALGLWDPDQRKTVMEISSLEQESPDDFPSQILHHSIPIPARVTALRTALLQSNLSLIMAGSSAGDVSVILVNETAATTRIPAPVVCPSLHRRAVSALDLEASTQDCVTVGQDGKINLVKMGGLSQLQSKCLYDNSGLLSFSAVSWASPFEFVTGSLGFTLQWWDQRRPGGPVSQSPAKW
jgi:nuclear pore complex protein Nup43